MTHVPMRTGPRRRMTTPLGMPPRRRQADGEMTWTVGHDGSTTWPEVTTRRSSTTRRPDGGPPAGRSSTGWSSSSSPCWSPSSCARSCSPTSSSTARRWYTTLHDGDRVFVNKLSYRLHDPQPRRRRRAPRDHGGVRPRPDQAGHRPARRDDRGPQLPGADRRPRARGAVPRSGGRHAGELRRRHWLRSPCPRTTSS